MSNLIHLDVARSRPPLVADAQADIDLLHAISVELIGEQDRMALYRKIVDAAVSIMQSQFGTMQLLCPADDASGRGGQLQLLASRGLPAEAEIFWRWVSPKAATSCAMALKSGRREIVPDYEAWAPIEGAEEQSAFRQAGIRAAQTTPLTSRGGELLGMISTHWTHAHEPSERDLRLLDILARQAADLLERTIAEEALRAREHELSRTCAALRESEELQKMLTGELSHRVKNMLATVQAIASQTLRHSDDPADFVESFGGRIQSMSRVHSQLSQNDWKGTRLHEIVRDQMKLGPVDERQIRAVGPDVHLDAAAVPKIAMMLHELGVNSLKYGALSKTDGVVRISWIADGRSLDMQWVESGGPKVSAPSRRGFGTRLIESSVRGAGGSARMTAAAEGVRWDIVFPLPAEASSAERAGRALNGRTSLAREPEGLAHGAERTALRGKRILVVEDEPLLAMDILGQLEDAGAKVLGPAASVREALELIDLYRLDAALLDGNLNGGPIDEIAAALVDRNVVFAFMSGYGRAPLPDFDAPLLPKPFNATELLDAAEKLFG